MPHRPHLRPATPQDFDLPSLGAGGEQVVLALDAVPTLRGNRSRVVLISNLLEASLGNLAGELRLVVLQQDVPPQDRGVLRWLSPTPGVLLHLEHFGGLVLEGLRGPGEPFTPERQRPLRQGHALELALFNPSVTAQRAVVVLLVDAILG